MESSVKSKRRAAVDESHCVACGGCCKVCPMNAISIWKGLMAKVDLARCVGCGRCVKECPASVITLREAGA